MRSIIRSFYFAITILMLMSACSRNTQQPVGDNSSRLKEDLLHANKAAINEENMQIESLISRNNWQMEKSGTGLRYMQLEDGSGPKVHTGNRVTLEYEVRLADGKMVYSSQKTGYKVFTAGSGGVESGLEEGILLMKKGDRFRFVIPSYLAYGLSGDQDQIPQKATLIYIVKLIEIQ